MIFKIAAGATATIGGLCFVNDSFYLKLDRNLLRPVRDYRYFL